MSDLTQEILDALPAHIALLDSEGRIKIINEAWRKFGLMNGLHDGDFAVGRNYFAIFEKAYGKGADDTTKVSAGIRNILSGAAPYFELKKYSCHSSTKKFWFRATVTPIIFEKRRCALVAHIDITERDLAEQGLHESEQDHRALAVELDRERERLVTAQAVAKVGSWETNLLTMEVFWSAETYRIFEVAQGTFIPTHDAFLDLLHPDDRAAVDDAFRQSIFEQSIRSIDHRIRLPENRLKYITETWQIIFDDKGSAIRAVGTCQDTSERQAIHARLRESEARLERAQEVAGIGSWEIDVMQGSVFLSKQMYQIRGLVPDNNPLLLRDIQQVVAEDLEKVTAWLQRLEAGEDVPPLEVSIRRPDGAVRIVSNEAKPIFDRDGLVTKISGTQRDITDARHAERELRQSRLHLAVAQRVASIGSAAIDFRTGKWDWSDETFRIYGVNRSQFTPSAEALGTLLHPDDRDELLSKPALALRGVTPPPIEYRIKRPDGVERILRREATLVWDDSGEVIGIVGTVQDVTDLRAAEREKNLLQAQLRQGQRLEAVGQMTGGIAHDFNNLLTVILGNAEVFERHLSKNRPLRELAEMTRLAAERGAALTGQLLAFSRQQPLDPKPIDVNALVSGMYKLLRRALGEHFRINTVCSPGLWQALIDAAQLESAILNLSVNARDAMPAGGCLTIETRNVELDESYVVDQTQAASDHSEIVPGQYVMIAISDTGTGMDEATRLKAFDPFFTTKDVGKGSGLGLSMVYGFVRQSKGHIRIYSELGHGTTIKLYLARANETTTAPEAQLEDSSLPGGTERILLVEDDDLVRNQVSSQLTSLGYDVVTAEDGVESLELLRTTEEFDLLFTDVVMPRGINGRELADQALRLRPDLRVLFTSGYAENAIVHHGRLDPGVHLLNKPYRSSELAAKIRYVFDQA